MSLRVRAAVATDRGQKRQLNEDAVGAGHRPGGAGAPDQSVWVVCDGMGGHAAGEIASRLAVETILKAFADAAEADPAVALERAIRAANRAVWEAAEADRRLSGMGATVVSAVLFEDQLIVAHAGDSRAYLWREGGLRQLTDDHSWLAEQTRLGLIAPGDHANHPMRHSITRALGAEPDVLADVMRLRLRPGDRVLLCSDGLSNEVAEAEIERVLREATDPDAAVHRLIDAANAAGGDDNISVVVLRLDGEAGPADPAEAGATPAGAARPAAPTAVLGQPGGAMSRAGGPAEAADRVSHPAVEVSKMSDPAADRSEHPLPEAHGPGNPEHPPKSLGRHVIEAILLLALAVFVLWFLSLATAVPAVAPGG